MPLVASRILQDSIWFTIGGAGPDAGEQPINLEFCVLSLECCGVCLMS